MKKILLLLVVSLVLCNGQSIATNSGENKTDQKGDNYVVAQWKVIEITLNSSKNYTDPFSQVEVTATFTGPDGKTIRRPAFWDGGSTWKIRFAPTAPGVWNMLTSCSDDTNSGLHAVSKAIKNIPL